MSIRTMYEGIAATISPGDKPRKVHNEVLQVNVYRISNWSVYLNYYRERERDTSN